jgi:hypothetical protein
MKAEYLRDHPIRPLEEWTGDQHLDWLHPSHGPLPTKIGSIVYGSVEYVVCLWLLTNRIVTVTEIADVSKINDKWYDLPDKKGWIMHSLTWLPHSAMGFSCEGQHVRVPEILRHKPDQAAEGKLLEEVMLKSVEITAHSMVGTPIIRLHDTMKG